MLICKYFFPFPSGFPNDFIQTFHIRLVDKVKKYENFLLRKKELYSTFFFNERKIEMGLAELKDNIYE